jgi:hypothetical protein
MYFLADNLDYLHFYLFLLEQKKRTTSAMMSGPSSSNRAKQYSPPPTVVSGCFPYRIWLAYPSCIRQFCKKLGSRMKGRNLWECSYVMINFLYVRICCINKIIILSFRKKFEADSWVYSNIHNVEKDMTFVTFCSWNHRVNMFTKVEYFSDICHSEFTVIVSCEYLVVIIIDPVDVMNSSGLSCIPVSLKLSNN